MSHSSGRIPEHRERNLKLRQPGRGHPTIVLTLRTQVILGILVFATSAWLTVATVSYLGSRSLLLDKADSIRNLELQHATLRLQSQASTAAFLDQVGTLEATATRLREAVQGQERIRGSLERQLASRERQIDVLGHERNEARAMLSELKDASAGGEAEMARLIEQRTFFASQSAATQKRLAEVTFQRDTGGRVEQALRWEVARLKSQIESRALTAELWFEDWVAERVASLEQLFTGTGVDIEVLVGRAAENEVAQGGPYQGIDAPVVEPGLAAVDPLAQTIRRLTALQRLTRSLPLASPLDHFHVTSGFGKRRDPFTRKWAFHSGLDLGAAPGSEILTTAPGIVVSAGPFGPYGNMVEIDHGMGVTTRYGHLKTIAVAVGDEVAFRQPVGEIGTTGRSTARHLHYEVRIDGQVQDPAKFLEAGRFLVDVFDLQEWATTGSGAG